MVLILDVLSLFLGIWHFYEFNNWYSGGYEKIIRNWFLATCILHYSYKNLHFTDIQMFMRENLFANVFIFFICLELLTNLDTGHNVLKTGTP